MRKSVKPAALPPLRPRVYGGLRMRLTITYLVFFAILLAGIGWFFREALRTNLDSRARELLKEEWAALRGYLRIQGEEAIWAYDRDDAEESANVERLRRFVCLLDANGNTIEVSNGYLALTQDSEAEIVAAMSSKEPVLKLKYNGRGEAFLTRQGLLRDEGRDFFLAIALPIQENQNILDGFTRTYFTIVPLFLLGTAFVGWILAGRALRPLNDLLHATEQVSGANLSVRIPTRNTGDELDVLSHRFNQMLERLERNFEQVRQFSTDASHELRTPLTAIRGQLEVALFTAKTPDDYRSAMENALQDVERLSNIVKSLLTLSKAETGQVRLELAPIDLSVLVRDVVSQFDLAAEEKQIKLTAALPPACVATVDRMQFERLLANLVSNAVKYTPPRGSVTISLGKEEENIVLRVSDTGIGISPEHLPYLFERFFRVSQKQGDPDRGLGLGLGLSFVHWIAKAHKGSVHVDSTPGLGTTFTVSFPQNPQPEPALTR